MSDNKVKAKMQAMIDEQTEQLHQVNINLKNIIYEVVDSLSRITEIRDPYTAGHQKRVSRLAVDIAVELGLENDMIDGIRIAGMLHDVGKIYVPQEFLAKPTMLDDTEMAVIKRHSQIGYDILKDISFPWPVAEIVLQHHERFNGSGYPSGLCNEDMLLEARILAVADVVEAMSSHRPYRPALGIDRACKSIIEYRENLFCPACANACVEVVKRHNSDLFWLNENISLERVISN